MEGEDVTPESNAEIVALNIVSHAVTGEINSPGESLAGLLDRMRLISQNVGGDYHAAGRDWMDTSKIGIVDEAEIKNLVNRQVLAVGDMWAQHWMLMHLAKHLYQELEERCLGSHASSAIEKIEYDENGNVVRWTIRSNRPRDVD